MENKITLDELKNILADTALKMVTPVRVTKDTAGSYYSHLQEYPAGLVCAACEYHIEGPDGKFFPQISSILENIREILRLAMGIPSALEAWGMIQDSARYKEAVYCRIGADLRAQAEKAGKDYLILILRMNEHEKDCGVCHRSYNFDDFGHPAVTETVRRLGGKQYILTGNPTSDRARWVEAYTEVIQKEFRMITTSPSIRGYIESISVKPAGVLEDKIQALTARLSAPAHKASNGLPQRADISTDSSDDQSKGDRFDYSDILKQERAAALQNGERYG